MRHYAARSPLSPTPKRRNIVRCRAARMPFSIQLPSRRQAGFSAPEFFAAFIAFRLFSPYAVPLLSGTPLMTTRITGFDDRRHARQRDAR